MLVYLPLMVLQQKNTLLIQKLFPEIVLLLLFLSVFISSMVIDILIVVSTAFFYLFNREHAGA